MSVTLAVGVAVVKIVLVASGHGDAALMAGDAGSAAGALLDKRKADNPFGRRKIEKVGAQVAAGLDDYFKVEFSNAKPHDRDAAVQDVADLLQQRLQDDPQRLLDAVIDPERLLTYLRGYGGRARRKSLGGDAGQIFNLLLKQCVAQIAELTPQSAGFSGQALTRLMRDVDRICADLDQLLERPVTGGVAAADAQGYRSQVEALAPAELKDRDDELGVLADYALQGPGRWFGYQARPKAGKSALLTTFALHPPRGVLTVPFLVLKDQSEYRTRSGFLGVVLARLAKLAGRAHVPFPTNPHQQHQILASLLAEAAAACQARTPPEQLLLIVDGMDEDAYYSDPTGQTGSIAALLPVDPPSGVRILVARRTNPPPPGDLPPPKDGRDHPLVEPATWHELSVSEHATAAFTDEDVDDLMRDAVGEAVGGYLAAAGGPLTIKEMRGLLRVDGLPAEFARLRDLTNHRSGRLLIPIPVPDNPAVPGYRLGHDLITRRVITHLMTDDRPLPADDDQPGWDRLAREVLAPYRRRLRAWADTYATTGWVNHVPDYLLSATYPALLHRDAAGDPEVLECLVDTLTDPHRIAAIRQRHDTSYPALRQVRDAAAWMVAELERPKPLDLYQLARLIVVDERLTSVGGSIPADLPAIYVRLGNRGLALNLADGLREPEHRVQAQTGVAKAIAAIGDGGQALIIAERALTIIAQIADPRDASRARASVADAFAAAGDCERALSIADQIADPRDASRALAEVAIAVVDAGDPQRALTIAEHARAVNNMNTIFQDRARVMGAVAKVFATAGDSELARVLIESIRTVADQIDDPEGRARALAKVAIAVVDAGDPQRALTIAEHARTVADQIADPEGRARALAEVAIAVVDAGDPQRALTIAEHARTIADQITQELARERRNFEIAEAFAAAGDSERALTIADQIADPEGRARALAKVAIAVVDAGDPQRALTIAEHARDINNMNTLFRDRARGINAVAEAFASAGDPQRALTIAERALTIVDQISNTWDASWARAGVARGFATAGDPERALTIADQIADPEGRARALAEVAIAVVDAGDPQRALTIAERALILPDPEDRALVLAEVAIAVVDAGDPQRALTIAERALTIAGQGDLVEGQARVLARIAEAFAIAGNPERALTIAGYARTIAERGGKWALAKVAKSFAIVGNPERALTIADQ